ASVRRRGPAGRGLPFRRSRRGDRGARFLRRPSRRGEDPHPASPGRGGESAAAPQAGHVRRRPGGEISGNGAGHPQRLPPPLGGASVRVRPAPRRPAPAGGGRGWRDRRGLQRGPLGTERGRPGGGRADLPPRERGADPRGHAPLERAVITRLIAWCASNRLVTLLVVTGLAGVGLWALRTTPLDALPDLSEVQVIVFSEWEGRSPDLVEDQVTYPLVTSLLGTPHVS